MQIKTCMNIYLSEFLEIISCTFFSYMLTEKLFDCFCPMSVFTLLVKLLVVILKILYNTILYNNKYL